MNNQPMPSEDPLETLLRQEHAPIADDGFSARVLGALPPPATQPRMLPSRRAIACSLGTVTGLIVTFARSGLPQANDLTAFGAALENVTLSVADSLGDPTVLTVGLLILSPHSLLLTAARS